MQCSKRCRLSARSCNPPAAADSFTVEQIRVFEFRSRGRIPAMSYRHTNGQCIFRASQPKTGLSKNRCKEDEVHNSSCVHRRGKAFSVTHSRVCRTMCRCWCKPSAPPSAPRLRSFSTMLVQRRPPSPTTPRALAMKIRRSVTPRYLRVYACECESMRESNTIFL